MFLKRLVLRVKKLVYPFTFDEWLNHPSTKPKLKWCKKMGAKIDSMRKGGKQLKLDL